MPTANAAFRPEPDDVTSDTGSGTSKATFSPRETVSELDRYIIGQKDAKRAVAIALRNRWRRQQLTGPMREEVLPKNILMIGPTGVGKTEISRRLAKLANAPFIKVEATKFTEVGYVGRDVEQIIRDLVEVGHRPGARGEAPRGAGEGASAGRGARARRAGRRACKPDDARELSQAAARRRARRQGDRDPGEGHLEPDGLLRGAGHAGRLDRRDECRRDARQGVRQGRTKTRKVTVKDSYELLLDEEADKLLDQEQVVQEAIRAVENDGIVFLDEIDKIARASDMLGGDVRARACSATCCRSSKARRSPPNTGR